MKVLIRISTCLILFSLFVLPTYAQQLSVSNGIDVFLKSKMQERSIPALQMAVVREGRIVKDTTFGIANLEYNIKATKETVFSINSITKAFVGIAIMQLSEAGKLKISDPISLYLDGLPEAWQKITIKQAMSHISSLPDVMNADKQVIGHNVENEAMAKVKALPTESAILSES